MKSHIWRFGIGALVLVVLPYMARADAPEAWSSADVIFLGEIHDNPHHHVRQAELVARLRPSAVVYEMLTPDQAARATPELLDDPVALERALGWHDAGWPDFEMYHPIFTSAPRAAVIGAAFPRDQARRAMTEAPDAVFGEEATAFGLAENLPGDVQSLRETLQAEAHCNALPDTLLPSMVAIQRLRDAIIARAARDAVTRFGPPVVVITGNGHARRDWGAPAALARAAPDLDIRSLGQGEAASGPPPGGFDAVEISSDVARDDPCQAFQ